MSAMKRCEAAMSTPHLVLFLGYETGAENVLFACLTITQM
jgi:hypothetical protein